MTEIDRRNFLKLVGVGAGAAAAAGCSDHVEKLIPYVIQPEVISPGLPIHYASTCRECPAGCGLHVKTLEGRECESTGLRVTQTPCCPRAQETTADVLIAEEDVNQVHGGILVPGILVGLHALVPHNAGRSEGDFHPVDIDETPDPCLLGEFPRQPIYGVCRDSADPGGPVRTILREVVFHECKDRSVFHSIYTAFPLNRRMGQGRVIIGLDLAVGLIEKERLIVEGLCPFEEYWLTDGTYLGVGYDPTPRVGDSRERPDEGESPPESRRKRPA